MERFLVLGVIVLLSLHLARPAAAIGADAPAAGHKKLFHVVSIKFKDSATKEQVAEVEQAFVALKDKIPGVVSLDWGTNVSPENRSMGFTHCFVLTFASESDRDTYLHHPTHLAFVKTTLEPVLDQVLVIDFWSQE